MEKYFDPKEDKNLNYVPSAFSEIKDSTVEEKLRAIYELQKIESQIDNLIRLRGELPIEVQDLEDEVEALKNKSNSLAEEIENFNKKIREKRLAIEISLSKINKYNEQLENVTNSREFNALKKEIEFQQLEVQLYEKHIKEYEAHLENLKKERNDILVKVEKLEYELELKKKELNQIIKETQKEEEELKTKLAKLEKIIDPRLLSAFKRIRKNMRNGLAVVKIEREACGGCFAKIPPQRQLEIKMKKKIIVCEYCGRILVAPDIDAQKETKEVNPSAN